MKLKMNLATLRNAMRLARVGQRLGVVVEYEDGKYLRPWKVKREGKTLMGVDTAAELQVLLDGISIGREIR